MTAVVLPPRELAVEHAHVYRRHLLPSVIFRRAKILRAQQAEYGPCRNGGHITTLVIEPFRISLFWDTVADERQPGRTQRYELMGIHGQITSVLAAECSFRGAVLHEVSRHPVVLARSREILHRFTPVTAMQLGPAFT